MRMDARPKLEIAARDGGAVDDALMKDVRLPEHVIQGATITRGEL